MQAMKVSLERDGDTQTIRIPKPFEMPGTEVLLHREAETLVIEPAPRESLLAYLRTAEPCDIDFTEIEDPPPNPVDL